MNKFPRFNGKQIDEIRKKEFTFYEQVFIDSITRDNDTNELGLTEKDIELLAYNITCEALLRTR
jgi:hypothetical protein